MTLRLQSPEVLWLLLAAAPAALIALRFFTGMSPWRRVSAAAARVLLIAAIVGALAGASSVRITDRLAVVAVIDVSGSARAYATIPAPRDDGTLAPLGVVDAAKRFLAHAHEVRAPDDLLGVVVFDGRSLAVASPTRGDPSARAVDLAADDGTNIEQALRLAGSMIPPGVSGRLLLVSDGVETSGNALEAAADLAGAAQRSRLPIDVTPLAYVVTNEVVVESLDTPSRASAGSTITARVVLHSTGPARGRLYLSNDGDLLDINGDEPGIARPIALEQGRHVELITVTLNRGRLHRFEARFEADAGDTSPANNHAEAFVLTPDAGAVLVVDGVGGGDPSAPGAILAHALEASGVDATLRPADGGVPESMLELQAFDAIFLQNVPADAVSEAAQALLVEYVRELGGGLVMIGGPDSFGAGGWKGSLVEPLLPVGLDVPDRIMVPETAIVFVLDNSGSMRRGVLGSSRSQQQIANESAALAVRSLDDKDLIGVVTFNSQPDLVWALAPNDRPNKLVDSLLRINSGGGTNLAPALALAREQLDGATAKTRHVIVLSDGRSSDQEQLPAMAEAMARDGISVSAIAVGDQADTQTLQDIATLGQGHFYNVLNPTMLPRVFVKAVRVVRSPLIREGVFDPRVIDGASPLVQGLGAMPTLSGLVLTRPRPEASIVHALADASGDPLLSHWNVELGQVVAFTSDAHRWASNWVDWPGYARFWTQIARRVARSASASGMTLNVEPGDGQLRIQLDASGPAGKPIDLLTVQATVYPPSGPPREVVLNQVGPGLYTGTTPAREPGSHVVIAKPTSGSTRLPAVLGGGSVGSSIEGRSLSSNVTLLKNIAERTGGRLVEPDELVGLNPFDREGARPSEARTPLWRALIAWALVVFMLDVGTRRIAWDRFVSRRYGADLRRAAREAVARRDQASLRTIGVLKAREPEAAIESPSALGEADARRVAQEQADARRRATRDRIEALRAAQDRERDIPAAAAAPEGSAPARDAAAPASMEPASGDLLAAKRRARDRFVDPTEPTP